MAYLPGKSPIRYAQTRGDFTVSFQGLRVSPEPGSCDREAGARVQGRDSSKIEGFGVLRGGSGGHTPRYGVCISYHRLGFSTRIDGGERALPSMRLPSSLLRRILGGCLCREPGKWLRKNKFQRLERPGRARVSGGRLRFAARSVWRRDREPFTARILGRAWGAIRRPPPSPNADRAEPPRMPQAVPGLICRIHREQGDEPMKQPPTR